MAFIMLSEKVEASYLRCVNVTFCIDCYCSVQMIMPETDKLRRLLCYNSERGTVNESTCKWEQVAYQYALLLA